MNAAGPGSSLPALRPQDQSFMPDVAAPLVADPYGARPPLGLRLSDLLITLRLRWMPLLAAFCLPVALGIGGAMLLKPRFTADSVLMVLLNRESTTVQDVSGIGPSVVSVELLRVVRGEAEILGSDDVLRRALRRVGIGTLFPELKPPPATGGSTPEEMEMAAAVDAFRRVLAVEADTNANILRARVTLPDRALAIQALAAVVDSYVERRGEMYSDENSRLLSAELSRYSDRLRQTEAEIAALRDQYGVLDIGQEMSLTATRLDNIRQRQDGLREQQVTAEAQLAAAQQRLGAEPDRVFASQEATNLAPNDDSRNQLARLLLERERMARQYNPDYPPLREMEGRIAAARAAIRESTRATYSTTRQVRNPNLELLNQRVVTLEVEADALKRQGEELARQRTELEARRTELVQADTRLRALQRAREGMEAVTRQLTTREAATRMEEDARRQRGNTITVVQPATAPLEGRGIRRLVALGGVAGGIALA
ncbi:GumC family protein, partial [Teichococcus wenyumeiae]